MVFTCVTDTASLIWSVNGDTNHEIIYHSESPVNQPILDKAEGIFIIKLLSTTDGLKSTATAYNVSLNSNGSTITCSNNTSTKNYHDDTENSEAMSIIIG